MMVEIFRHGSGWRWRLYDEFGHVLGASLRDYPQQEDCREQAAVLFPGARVNVVNGTEGGPP